MDKQTIAKEYRHKRVEYTVEQRAPWDLKIHDVVMDYTENHQVIGLYCATNGEVDTYGIMETLFQDPSKIVAIPKVFENRKMVFYRITSFKDLVTSKQGILEPITDEVVEPELVFTPLSVFNQKGYRIGYGGGYYDRYFELHSNSTKIGLAYSFQYADIEFQEAHDVACDMIITERNIYYEDTQATI